MPETCQKVCVGAAGGWMGGWVGVENSLKYVTELSIRYKQFCVKQNQNQLSLGQKLTKYDHWNILSIKLVVISN